MLMSWLRRVIRREIEAERAERDVMVSLGTIGTATSAILDDHAAALQEVAKSRAEDLRKLGHDLMGIPPSED